MPVRVNSIEKRDAVLLGLDIPCVQAGTLFGSGAVQPKAALFGVYPSVARRLSFQLAAQQDISTVIRAGLPRQDRQTRPAILFSSNLNA